MSGGRYNSGLEDKLYWRFIGGGTVAHCYKRCEGSTTNLRIWASLCGRVEHVGKIGRGQRLLRPPPMLRCGGCDVAEIKRRNWDESGPDSKDWEDGRR